MLIWRDLLEEKQRSASDIHLSSSRRKFSVWGSCSPGYVRDYECRRERRRTKEVVIKVNLPRTRDCTRNVARISKATDFCQGHAWRLVYHSPGLKNITWASKGSQRSVISMCFPLGSEEMLRWLLQMEWRGNFQISFQLGRKAVCQSGHPKVPALSKAQRPTVIRSHLWAIENDYLVTYFLCGRASI